jgi:hypothetical protein
MTETTLTMTVKEKSSGRVRIINASDFNAEVHELADAVKVTPTSTFDRKAAQAALKQAGVEFAKNASDEKLQELLDGLNKQPALSIKEVDGKFLIVDANDVQQGEEVFGTVEDAEMMLSLLTGK